MSKLEGCQFIQITIDGEVINGASEEKKYLNWLEGYSPAGLATYVVPNDVHFDTQHISVVATEKIGTLFEKVLKRGGYKSIIITVVHRGSCALDPDYETQRTTYTNCKINSFAYDLRDRLYVNISFTVEKMIELTLQVPNDKNNALSKIGPIKYDIAEKTLK